MCSYNNNKWAQRKLEVIDMSIILMVMMVSWVYTYVQTNQIVYIKYIVFNISIISQ